MNIWREFRAFLEWRRSRSITEIVDTTLRGRTSALAQTVTANNALLSKLQEVSKNRPKPKPLTRAQKAKLERDRKLGEKYLAKAHALGVYEDHDYD